MKKLLLALLLLLPTTAFASSQVLVSGNITYTSGTAKQYMPMGYGINGGYNANTADNVRPQIAAAGTINTMRVALNRSPGAGTSYKFTLYKNAVLTGVTCTIADTNTSCSDLVDSVTVAAGDRLGWEIAPTNTPTPIAPDMAVTFTPTNANDTVFILAAGNQNLTLNSYVSPSVTSGGFVSNDNATTRVNMPIAGVFDQFYMKIQTAPGTGSTLYALRLAAATTSLSCSIATTGTSCTDLADSGIASANDPINIVAAPSGITSQNGVSQFGFRFRSTTPGSFLFFSGSAGSGGSGVNATPYYSPISGVLATTTEANAQMVVNAMNVTNLTASLVSSLPVGDSFTYTFRVNGVNTGLTCTITNPALTCVASGFVHVNDGDLVNMQIDNPNGVVVGSHFSLAASSGDNFFQWWLLLLSSLI